jgi:hypothetical protein
VKRSSPLEFTSGPRLTSAPPEGRLAPAPGGPGVPFVMCGHAGAAGVGAPSFSSPGHMALERSEPAIGRSRATLERRPACAG